MTISVIAQSDTIFPAPESVYLHESNKVPTNNFPVIFLQCFLSSLSSSLFMLSTGDNRQIKSEPSTNAAQALCKDKTYLLLILILLSVQQQSR